MTNPSLSQIPFYWPDDEPSQEDLSGLIVRLESALELLGKASRFQIDDAVVWEIHSPNLLSGMRRAAELSLKQDGEENIESAIASAMESYPSSPFLALRNLLNEQVLAKLVERFEKEVATHKPPNPGVEAGVGEVKKFSEGGDP